MRINNVNKLLYGSCPFVRIMGFHCNQKTNDTIKVSLLPVSVCLEKASNFFLPIVEEFTANY